MHVDAVPRPAERQLDAVMNQALLVQPGTRADAVEQRHGAFLEQAGADPPQHVIRRLPLKNDVVYAESMK
ncbi:hypothetical protein BraRD5C2_00190 [Bradyrhizobium sp. RD5-C2]|nr:hypothetical protein BraRD5C2_00190 [Bradyrhizobium sp. RD5-C2]